MELTIDQVQNTLKEMNVLMFKSQPIEITDNFDEMVQEIKDNIKGDTPDEGVQWGVDKFSNEAFEVFAELGFEPPEKKKKSVKKTAKAKSASKKKETVKKETKVEKKKVVVDTKKKETVKKETVKKEKKVSNKEETKKVVSTVRKEQQALKQSQIKFLTPFIKKGKSARKELIDLACKELPNTTKKHIMDLISYGKNEKYNRFEKLVVEKDKIIKFAK